MKIKSLQIDGIGRIGHLRVTFDDHMNFICGPNGIGKTTLLECVAHSFSATHTNILKRSATAESGNFQASIEIEGGEKSSNVTIGDFDPQKNTNLTGLRDYAKYVMSLKVTRTFQYQRLDAVGRDSEKHINHLSQEATQGVNVNDVKNWFVNRFLYSAHEGAISE